MTTVESSPLRSADVTAPLPLAVSLSEVVALEQFSAGRQTTDAAAD